MAVGDPTSRPGVDAGMRAIASLGAGITAGIWLASTARQFGDDGMSGYLMLAEGVAEAGAVTAFFLVAFGISGWTRPTGLAVKLAAAGSLIVAASWLRPPVASANMSSVTELLVGAAAGLLLGGVIAFHRAPLSSSLVAAGLVGVWFLPPAGGWARAAMGAVTALALMTVGSDAGRQPPPVTASTDRRGPEPARAAALIAAVVVIVTTWLAYDLAPNRSGSPRLSEYLSFAVATSATAVAVPLLLAVTVSRLAGWAGIAWTALATGAVWLNLHALPHVAGAADGPRAGRWVVVLAGVAVGLVLASGRPVERHPRHIVASGLIFGGVLLALDNAVGLSYGSDAASLAVAGVLAGLAVLIAATLARTVAPRAVIVGALAAILVWPFASRSSTMVSAAPAEVFGQRVGLVLSITPMLMLLALGASLIAVSRAEARLNERLHSATVGAVQPAERET